MIPPRCAGSASRNAHPSPRRRNSSLTAGWGDGRESRARAAATCRPRPEEPFGSAVGPGGGSAWRGLATMPTRHSRRRRLAAGRPRIARKRRADGPPAPTARLPALRTFPRDCRPTRAALGGGTGGGNHVRSRTSCCDRGFIAIVVLADKCTLALLKKSMFVVPVDGIVPT